MLTKAKAKFDVVSIVNGAQSARRNIASNLDFVNKYEKVFLAFDNDEPGIAAANDVAHVIKPGKAHIVNSMYKDANDALCKEQSIDYLSQVWGAKVYKPDNFVSGEKIWEAFKERSKVESVPYPDCLKGVNDKVFGQRLGEITLFTSGTGSGKSTVVKETILNLLEKTNSKVGLISLEESIGDTATKLIGMAINKNIRMPEDVTEDEARKGYEKVFGDERLINKFFDQLTSQDLDELFQGAMFMTEQHAGSDVGSIDTFAENINGQWYLTGDKWFCSNPDADLAMVLARYDKKTKGTKGLSLFLLPKKLENGQHNNYEIIRLKDKLGGRSFASGEIRLNKAFAYIVGEKKEGFKQMTDMINMSRLSNGVRASGMMQRCLQESLFIAKTRSAFNKKLINLPLIRKQLLKILIITEASRTMVFKAAEILEKADKGDTEAQKIFRIITPLIKFRACGDVRKIAGDAMEIRGGSGYIEEWMDPKILRDAHLGSIWEGTSNIISLDTIRALKKADNLHVLKTFLINLVHER